MALTVTIAVCVVLTEATFAENDALDAPEGIVTLAGTVTELLLLATATLMPVEGATELRDTVHDVVPAPVNEMLLHDNVSIVGVAPGAFEVVSEIEIDFTMAPWVALTIAV